MGMGYYVLDENNQPREASSVVAWGEWMERSGRHDAQVGHVVAVEMVLP